MLEVNRSTSSEAGVSIAEAARRTGVSVHTLRYYERAGLVVTTVDRTAGNRRRYRQLDLDWINVCTRLRATGMPIRTIRAYADLVSAGRGNEKDRLELLETHRAEVLAKLAELQDNLELIDHKIDVYRGRLQAGTADMLWAGLSPEDQPSGG
ncbi:MerR family transcriptional regulator [Kribbella sp. NPDC002412]